MSPIKRENRGSYPTNWKALAAEIKQLNAYICQSCNLQCRTPDEPFDTHKRTLTIAHADSVYTEPAVLLLCLCAPCHLRYDAMAHAIARRQTRTRNRRAAGQLAMLSTSHSELSADDWQELADAWPELAYVAGLEDGIDFWADVPMAGVATEEHGG